MNISTDTLGKMNYKGVYSITNILDNKRYIGSTKKSFNSRLRQHINKLNKGNHHCLHLQNAWNKYGEENFSFTIEEVWDGKSNILDREAFYIEKYNSYLNGYNANPNPNTSPMYNKNSREKSSITHHNQWLKLKESMTSEEYQLYLKQRFPNNYGKTPVNKGKQAPEEWKEKMRKPKINGVSEKMKEVHLRNKELQKEISDYILVYDINKNWVNTFRCTSDLVDYSKSEFNSLPIIISKGKERFGRILDASKIATHATNGTMYKGLYFIRVPKSRKLSCANGMNSWKATQPIMSQAGSTLPEGAETTGEVKSS
jgi:group I intron endonuclease